MMTIFDRMHFTILAMALAAAMPAFAADDTPSPFTSPQAAMIGRPRVNASIVTEGSGTQMAKQGDLVEVEFIGWVLGENQAFTNPKGEMSRAQFRLGSQGIIQGMQLGVLGMKVGEKRTLTIPPDFAFGDKGSDKIPGNSTLRMDVTLLRILPQLKVDVTQAPPADAGEAIKAGDYAKVHYTGWLENGTKFDSSLDRGQPFEFGVGSITVINGWNLGVAGMKPGEKRTLVIPSYLAYGDRERPGIPPNSTLKFDIELLSSRPGVVVTTLKPGDEKSPAVQPGQVVQVHLKITTVDGKVIQDTQFGETLTIPLTDATHPRGLVLGMVGMKTNEQRRILIPPAWGIFVKNEAAGQTLWAEVDLVKIVK